jgi:hypothetical protein
VFAAHAVDTIATLEGVVRVAVGNCAIWGWGAAIAEGTMGFVQELAAVVSQLARLSDPRSAGLQHYYSFLGTLTKLRADPAAALRDRLRFSAAGEAASMLETVVDRSSQQTQVSSAAATAAAAATEQQRQQGDVISVLPSLVITGRGFLLLQQQLLQASADPGKKQARTVTREQLQNLRVSVSVAEVVQRFLNSCGTTVAAAGYPVETLQQQLQQLLLELRAVTAASSGSSSSSSKMDKALPAAMQQLRQTGLALCCMAVPCLCNSPGCTNISGPTELSLVSGRSCVWGLPCSPLLLPGLSVPALEAAQACVHCTGCGSSRRCTWYCSYPTVECIPSSAPVGATIILVATMLECNLALTLLCALTCPAYLALLLLVNFGITAAGNSWLDDVMLQLKSVLQCQLTPKYNVAV